MLVLFAVAGPGNPQGQIARQIISALIVLLACFTGAAVASWMAVASALRGGIRVWMDATAKTAVRSGCWPPLVPQRSRRGYLGPGLIVVYAFFTGFFAMIALLGFLLIPLSSVVGSSTPLLVCFVALEILCAVLGFKLGPRAIGQIEACGPWECYGDSLLHADDTGLPAAATN